MDNSFEQWVTNALAQYDKVVFLYQFSRELCAELSTILEKEKRRILLLTAAEIPSFPCDQRKLCKEECERLLKLYFSYSFSDRFILLTDGKELSWPSVANFMEEGLATRKEILEAMLE